MVVPHRPCWSAASGSRWSTASPGRAGANAGRRAGRTPASAADPRDPVARDAERLRHWLGQHEVDFVVRVYAAIMTTDTTLTRSAACAVVTTEQLPAWVASLPRQRSLTPERRDRLVGLLRDAT